MLVIYDLISAAIAIIYLPLYLLRRKFHREFFIRFGILPKNLKLDRPIWIHAVSVGETMAIRGLLDELRSIYPGKKFVISTITPTGNKIAKAIAKEGDFVTYLPLDFSFILRGAIDKIDPSLFIIAETEIWPNLISILHNKNIPIAVVNGRISDSSFKGYSIIKIILKPILNQITMFCVQTERDAARLIHLGVLPDKVKITGNMKFDSKDRLDSKDDYAVYREKMGIKIEEKLFVAGSTHSGEDEFVLDAYKRILNDFPRVKLLIAPRHPERTKNIEKVVIKFGFDPVRVSDLALLSVNPKERKKIFILDTVGKLLFFYAIADIVFVGGSLVKKGGHNILEPANLGKPVLFGQHMDNFRDIAELFIAAKAAILLRNSEELAGNMKYLLSNPDKIAELTRNAKRIIQQNQGATKRNIGYIRELIKQY
jgi:3-deoxy-D-manno-octulosonic-acid transferase